MVERGSCSGSTVYELFLHSLDPSAEVRRQSETNLDLIATSDGFLPHLIQLICTPQCEPHLKQAMVIYFKNKINRFWAPREGTKELSIEDKTYIKSSILNIVSTCDIPFIRIQLLSSLKSIIKFDFPSRWPELLQEISGLLESSRMHSMLTGLEALLRLISIQNFEDDEARHQIVEKMFPIILNITKGLKGHQAELSNDVLKIILKIFGTSIRFSLPECLQDEKVISEWIALMFDVLKLPCPPSFAIHDENSSEVEKKLFWKMKKWACRCINTLFCRYGSNSDDYMAGKLVQGFQKMFMTRFSLPMIRIYLEMLEGHCSGVGAKITNGLLCLCCDFLSQAIKPKITWNELQNHLEMLITKFIFPLCCFSDQDEALWEDDPAEYIREKLNPFSEVYDPTSACSNLLIDLAKTRKKVVFNSILSFLNVILNNYLKTPIQSRNAREKDGALYMVGCLSHLIESTPVFSEMESFLVAHVLPELQSKFPFLRARACWIFQQFNMVHFSEPKNALYVWEAVFHCMTDKDLPVRVQAGMAVGSLLDYDIVRESVRPRSGDLMQILMNLTNESDSDALSCVMDQLVEIFPEEISPFAANIITQLSHTIMQSIENYTPYSIEEDTELAGDANNVDSDDSDKLILILNLFRTINNIVDSIKSNLPLLAQVDQTMNPLIVAVLKNQVIDLYGDAFDYLETITFNLKSIPISMWPVYELIYFAFKENGADYLEEMSSFFDNVISYGTDVFLSSEKYQSMLFEIIQFSIFSEDLVEHDREHPCKLIESVLLNCKGNADHFLAKFIQFGLHLLKNDPKTLTGKVHSIQLLINCFLYNAALSVSLLPEQNDLVLIFTKWFEYSELFKRVHDKKLCVLAINEILKLKFNSLPPILQAGYSKLMRVAANMLATLPDAYKKRVEEQDSYKNGAFNEPDDIYQDDEEEEEEDIEYDNNSQSLNDGPEFIGFDDEDDYDDLYDGLDEELFFQTPLDSIDPFQTLHSTVRFIQANDPSALATLMAELSEAEKKQLETAFSYTQHQFESK